MLSINKYSTANKLQSAAFVQLKNPETGELEFTESGDKIGFELHSVKSNEFKRAFRTTADLGLTKAEQERHAEIAKWIEEGTKPSEESLDFLDECESKSALRMQKALALVTKKLHHIELTAEDAKQIGVKVNKGKVVETPENIHALYVALPDLSAQIADAIADSQNFINA